MEITATNIHSYKVTPNYMKIINTYPPNIEALHEQFSVKGKPIIYTYGDIIYNPMGVFVSPELMVHEQVHSMRQTTSKEFIEKWWTQYLADPEFRLNEELMAHKAEYKKYCDDHKDRNARALFLQAISQRLSSSMYGNMLSPNKARKIIQGI